MVVTLYTRCSRAAQLACEEALVIGCVTGCMQVVIGITLAATGGEIWAAWFVLALMCVYISAYAWSWGPLGWLYSRWDQH